MHISFFQKLVEYFDTIELVTLGILALAGILSERLLPCAAIAGLVFFLFRLASQRKIHFYPSIDLPILILLGMLAMSVFVVTALPDKSIPQALRLINGIWLFYSVARWGRVSSKRLFLIGVGLIGIGLTLAIVGLFIVRWFVKFSFVPIDLINALAPKFQDTIDPNVLSGSLVLILSGLFGVLLFGWPILKVWQRIILIIIGSYMTLILGLTQARGAYLGLAAALIFLIILRFKFGWLVLPLFISIILGAALIFGPSVLVDKINQVQSNASSMEVRVDIWTRAIYMIEDFPITGVGIGTFNNVADAYYPFYLEAPASVPHAHNLYLQIAVDLGIPGLLSWLVLLIFMFSSSLQIYKVGIKGNMPLQKVLGASLFAALIAMSVHGFLDSATWGNRPSIIIWLILGLIAAARTQSKQD